MADVPNRVRYLRAVRFGGELSQKELAERAGIDASTLSDIENQKTNPSALTAIAIARALGVTVEDLFLPAGTDGTSVSPTPLDAAATVSAPSRAALADEPPGDRTPAGTPAGNGEAA